LDKVYLHFFYNINYIYKMPGNLFAANLRTRGFNGGTHGAKMSNVILNNVKDIIANPTLIKSPTILNNKSDSLMLLLSLGKNPIPVAFDKYIQKGKKFQFVVIKSENKSVTIDTTFIENGDYFDDSIQVPKLFFEKEKNIKISFTYNLKYVGIMKNCNPLPNTVVDGIFTLTQNTDETYSLSSHTITDITYNPNDYCSDELSPYYNYDVDCYYNDIMDNEDCIEQNIWNVFNDMLNNAVVEINTESGNVDVKFKASNFHTKIKNIIGSYNYTHIDDKSGLILKFNTNSIKVFLSNVIAGGRPEKINLNENGEIYVDKLIAGDTVSVQYLTTDNVLLTGTMELEQK